MYGLEAVILRKKHLDKMERCQRRLLRTIQGLASTCATEAVYILAGALPVEAMRDITVLTLFGCVSRLPPKAALHRVASLQLQDLPEALPHTPASWFHYAANIAAQYSLNLLPVLDAPWPTHTWKQWVKTSVALHWRARLFKEATLKSSLKWLLLDFIPETGVHPIWSACQGLRFHVKTAMVRARMLTGKYPLQATRARYNQNEVDSTCKLCCAGAEDIQHLIADCTALEAVRCDDREKFLALFKSSNLRVPHSSEELCFAILNGGPFPGLEPSIPHALVTTFQRQASVLCFKLDRERDVQLNSLLMS